MNPSILTLALSRAAAELPDTRDSVEIGTFAGPLVCTFTAEGGGSFVAFEVTSAGLSVKEGTVRAPSLPAADVIAVLLQSGKVNAEDLRAAMVAADTASKGGKAAVKAEWAAASAALPLAGARGAVALLDPACVNVATLREVEASAAK